ncbi:hypothetical protein PQQ88_12450 [Paraburkholderia caledonica]|uniref:hypothetical protein n=1 Tax=Paraburkholderia caledonica TaxID=134536 RepID=UPI0038BA2897
MAETDQSNPTTELDETKVDSAIAQLSGAVGDLSQDDVPAPAADNIALQESAHRTNLQRHAFLSATGAAMLLYIAAMTFGGLLIYRYCVKGMDIDWHISALAGAFVVPPTVVIIALIRAIYHKEEKASGDSLPALNLLKDIAVAVKEAVKAVK